MNAFHQRISPQETVAIWQSAAQQGFLQPPQTSVIVHDLDRMSRRLRLLMDAFPPGTLHAIAIKANPLVEVLRVCVAAGCGLEAASREEVYVGLAAGCAPEQLVFDSPAKTPEEISEALQLGVHINADNFEELARIDQRLDPAVSNSTIGLRINPEVGAGNIAFTSVAGVGSKFGVSIEADRDRIVDSFRTYRWLDGLHIHIGSQGHGLTQLCAGVQKVQTLRAVIEAETGRRISVIDIGGGLPAAYADTDTVHEPHQYADALQQQVPELMDGSVRLVTEFGRAVQAGCGLALSRVEYVRTTADGEPMAVIHLGADFLLRPVYRPSDWSHEFVLLDREGNLKQGATTKVTLAGPLCFGGDILARRLAMPAPSPGDWIGIRDCGAYTLSMWSRHCSRGIPNVLGYENGAVRLLRRAESPQSIADFWR